MKTLKQIQEVLNSKVSERQAVSTGKSKGYEVVYEQATLKGIVTNTQFVKGTCPKDALKNFRSEMECVECYNVITIDSPTEVRGILTYKVYNNTHILR